MDGLTVITFDADGTLWDFTLVMRQALAAVLLALRERVGTPEATVLTVDDLIITRDQVAEEARGRGVRLEEIRRRSFERMVEQLGLRDEGLVSQLTATYFAHRFSQTGLYRDTRPALEQLTAGYRLGLISNGNSRAEQYGLQRHFDFTVYADGCGAAKPEDAFYRRVLERVGVAAASVLHVGDSLVNDVQGAQAAGMRAAWINRGGHHLPNSVHPDLVLRRLTDLPAILTGC